VLPCLLLVVLASSTCGDQHFCLIVTHYRPSSSGYGTSVNGL